MSVIILSRTEEHEEDKKGAVLSTGHVIPHAQNIKWLLSNTKRNKKFNTFKHSNVLVTGNEEKSASVV